MLTTHEAYVQKLAFLGDGKEKNALYCFHLLEKDQKKKSNHISILINFPAMHITGKVVISVICKENYFLLIKKKKATTQQKIVFVNNQMSSEKNLNLSRHEQIYILIRRLCLHTGEWLGRHEGVSEERK